MLFPYKAETELRFAEINRGINGQRILRRARTRARRGLWRFDSRWRRVIPRGAPVWLPQLRVHQDPRVSAG